MATAALVLLLGAASPGPSLAVVVRNTTSGGRSAGALCAIGHGLGFGIYALAAVVGLATLITRWETAFLLLQGFGALLLFWLGAMTLRHAGTTSDAHTSRSLQGFAEGFMIAFANPKIALFFVAVFAAVLQPGMSATTQGVIAAAGWFIDTSWYLLVALALSTAPATKWLNHHARRFDQAMGCILLLLSAATLGRLLTGL